MELEIYQVDSFTSQPFTGNPAGVCITQEPLEESLMYSIAEEMAVSETAFLTLSNMQLRWFTPKVEVALCGHGTLAVAHILAQKGALSIGESVAFNTLSGQLTAKLNHNSIELDFPIATLTGSEEEDNSLLLEALGLSPKQIIATRQFDEKMLIQVPDLHILEQLKPNFDALKQLKGRGVIVTALSNNTEIDFVSRYFAPWVGVNEDPVTGSAHCALAAYWQQALGKNSFNAYQASPRGGYIGIEIEGQRVKLSGTACTTISGVLHL
ncbi:PhzF family phenazine biosynthesis protein [Vibrio europaeus]|uniref:PhzF family phenazine biosynthesis protein n=1 Tax=Vibrio europaeus TaxID=300876 RepID=UPI00233F348B|nr:PhzF family phenazine biosynthesis protein [Vibrio europaeus]MDC5855391.1 PhzF family phenazine biosynthesis protein [Vibrio europaeus]